MAEEESLELEESVEPKSKKKLIIFAAIGVLLVILLGLGAWLLFSGDESSAENMAEGEQTEQSEPANNREAFYVGMPRPFLFNLPGQNRSRLVEIKVQLMVRGSDDDVLIKKHIPLIEDALLTTFSSADVQKLSSLAGKDELRQLALLNVQNTLQPVTGRKVVEKVLFTGFVMQ
ncbi:flagellar basal body-associated protein FliL [Shewanella insulae]|uniref:Flagellar protein FliL n=1 Tax=Shewanella insulae TaxID=2681496 RepID=A0A6L7HYX0_9GAMM|nr:flagellar basal body-associated protein FliL [Shewanella insulae]MCG9713230.1 flagellar basal body-associated protein FliL [Shewanella insulae]MCG9737568.1 flagellar basal body-associated protein FliL [Shewanella insulae]MCG9756908.1 flagellar basal body-associated protein FliL [Shewanella insulae]MXR69446.1 flagellar basal body-associated protein FliL [Shewanella insulae]